MQTSQLRGSELAWRAILLGQFGIGLRAIDRCAGGLRVKDLLVSASNVTSREGMTRGTLRAAESRAETHGRGGHDQGCASVGIPLSLIDQALARWDRSGASALITEAVHEAVNDILDTAERSCAWTPADARESLVYAIERRITPRAEESDAHTAAGPH